MANDLAHWFGSDLSPSASGDLLSVGEPIRSEQRLVRRLLTPPGSYIWHPTYGAGLGAFIGKPNAAAQIAAIVQAQIKLETAIAKTPAPSVSVVANANGVLVATIAYWNTVIGAPRQVSFPVNPNLAA